MTGVLAGVVAGPPVECVGARWAPDSTDRMAVAILSSGAVANTPVGQRNRCGSVLGEGRGRGRVRPSGGFGGDGWALHDAGGVAAGCVVATVA